MRHNWQQRYPGTNVVTVEEPHLLSPSTDTRRCATHVGEPRHTAKIQLSCHPCVNVHVLEESAEVRSTGASPRCLEDAWFHAPAIQVRESAKNPSRHGLNIIARVPLQTTSRERSGRCKCTNDVHMPRKTGEEKLLLLTVPTLRQRKKKTNPVPQYLGGPLRTACSGKRASAAAQRMLPL